MRKNSWLRVIFLSALLAIVAPLGISIVRDRGLTEFVKTIPKDLASIVFPLAIVVLIMIASRRLAVSRAAGSTAVRRVAGILPLGLRKEWSSGPSGRMYVIIVGVTAWAAICFLGMVVYLLIWHLEIFPILLVQFIVSIVMVATYFGLKWLLDLVFPEEPGAE
jgi:hypothetical protein